MNSKTLSRRTFLRKASYAIGAAASLAPALWWYGTELEPGFLEINRVRVAIPRLPRAFEGMTVAQMSDLHFGPWAASQAVHRAVDVVLEMRPSIVAVTGDYATTLGAGEEDSIVTELSRLEAPLGVYAVLGNHDYWTDSERIAGAVRRAGLRLLRNDNTAIALNGESIYLAGVDDVWEGKSNLALALSGIPDRACTILLAHEPDFADTVSEDTRAAFQISGHSHGGQIRLPVGGPLHLPHLGRKYPEGLRQIGEMQLYTNRGIGVVFPPVRINCRPEVTLFELTRAG